MMASSLQVVVVRDSVVRTQSRDAFASEGFQAHFVGCVAQIVIFVWDAPYECRLERCALFDDLLDLGG